MELREAGNIGPLTIVVCIKQVPLLSALRFDAEHIAGIRKAGYIVSINKNKRAPIFRHSNLAIVGDVHELLPILIARLEEMGFDNLPSPNNPANE